MNEFYMKSTIQNQTEIDAWWSPETSWKLAGLLHNLFQCFPNIYSQQMLGAPWEKVKEVHYWPHTDSSSTITRPIVASVMSDFVTLWTAASQAHHPWDSPGKNTGVGCHFLLHSTIIDYGYYYLIHVKDYSMYLHIY